MKSLFPAAAMMIVTGSAMAASSDQVFVTKAAQAGAAEVALGRLAASKSTTEAIRSFGQRMVDDHSKAGDQLSASARAAARRSPPLLRRRSNRRPRDWENWTGRPSTSNLLRSW